MSTLSDAFEAPVIFREGGLDLKLPRLDIDDHAAWIEELHPKLKTERLAKIAGNTPYAERKALTEAAERKPTIEDIARMLADPPIIKAAVDKALAKSGITDAAERLRIIKRIKVGRLQSLAMDVSGLYDRDFIEQPKDEKPGAGPLPGAGASPSEATSTPDAGPTPGSSSPSTPAASPSAE